MNVLRTVLVAAGCMIGANAAAVEYTMSCDEVLTRNDLEITEAARERFRELEGACMGVVERDGELYMHTEVVVRRVSGSKVVLYLPATDHTFEVQPSFNQRVQIGNSRVRARELSRGQELNVYLPVSAITQPVVHEIAFDDEEELTVVPAAPVAALPTTG